ncbi:MAG: DNA-processing protein DprA [Bacillota bacterium]|nr:DNA-processing protein DprA [Bacillota bacterium]
MEYPEQEKYWIWLGSIEGIGPKRFYHLIARYGDAKSVFERAEKGDPCLDRLPEAVCNRLLTCRHEEYFSTLFENLDKNGITVVTGLNPDYPRLLSEIADAPPILYKKGAGKLDFPQSVAIVGTRQCTRYGLENTRKIARELGGEGVLVVSGMARGIDSAAHIGALEAGGSTVAVFGCGVDIVYPPENQKLYERILESGAVISDYAPGIEPVAQYFPARNRIISGMCSATVVVEAGEKSGAMITAGYALEQGREVFALPGNVDSKASKGTNIMIRDGEAGILTDIGQILGLYDAKKSLLQSRESAVDPALFDENEWKIINCLIQGDEHYDRMLQETGLSVQDMNSTLTMLELRGIIKQLPGHVFSIAVQN